MRNRACKRTVEEGTKGSMAEKVRHSCLLCNVRDPAHLQFTLSHTHTHNHMLSLTHVHYFIYSRSLTFSCVKMPQFVSRHTNRHILWNFTVIFFNLCAFIRSITNTCVQQLRETRFRETKICIGNLQMADDLRLDWFVVIWFTPHDSNPSNWTVALCPSVFWLLVVVSCQFDSNMPKSQRRAAFWAWCNGKVTLVTMFPQNNIPEGYAGRKQTQRPFPAKLQTQKIHWITTIIQKKRVQLT